MGKHRLGIHHFCLASSHSSTALWASILNGLATGHCRVSNRWELRLVITSSLAGAGCGLTSQKPLQQGNDFSSTSVNEKMKLIVISSSLSMPLQWDFIVILMCQYRMSSCTRVFTESISEAEIITYTWTLWERIVNLLFVSYWCFIHSKIAYPSSLAKVSQLPVCMSCCMDGIKPWMDSSLCVLLSGWEVTQSRSKQLKYSLQMTVFRSRPRSDDRDDRDSCVAGLE